MSECLQYTKCTHYMQSDGFWIQDGFYRGEPVIQVKIMTHECFNQEVALLVMKLAQAQAGILHPNVLKVLDCFTHYSQSGQLCSSIVTEPFSRLLEEEIKDRSQYRQYWKERELMYHLYYLVNGMMTAALNGLYTKGVAPCTIYMRTNVLLLDLSWSWALAPGSTMCVSNAIYFSPELRDRELRGDVSPYDPEKCELYSLAAVFLFMVRLKPPVELSSSSSSRTRLISLIEEIRYEYPSLSQVLIRMLEPNPADRCGFEEVLQMIAQAIPPPDSPNYQLSSLRWLEADAPRREGVHGLCALCKAHAVSVEWLSDLPKDLKNFRGDFGSFCSLRCLRLFKMGMENSDMNVNCVHCSAVVPMQTVLSGAVVVLQCGHTFDTTDCFKTHLEGCRGGDFICSACKMQIDDKLIVAMTSPEYYEKLRKKVTDTWCNACFLNRATCHFSKCSHHLCSDCLRSSSFCYPLIPTSLLSCAICCSAPRPPKIPL